MKNIAALVKMEKAVTSVDNNSVSAKFPGLDVKRSDLPAYFRAVTEGKYPVPYDPSRLKYDSFVSSQNETFPPLIMGYLTEKMEEIAIKVLHETPETKENALRELRRKIKEEKNFYCRTDETYLLQFLRVRKYDVDAAFLTVQNYFKFAKTWRHVFKIQDNTPVHDLIRKNIGGYLPYREQDGAVVAIAKVGAWDPAEISRDLLIWAICEGGLFSLEDIATQVMGYSLILDLRGVGLKHFRMLNVENIMLIYNVIKYSFPGRVKGIHVFGLPSCFKAGWAIVYPFLFNTKLKKRVHIHGNDLRSLHKYLPTCILPEEYGGEQGPLDNSGWHSVFLTINDWTTYHSNYGYQD